MAAGAGVGLEAQDWLWDCASDRIQGMEGLQSALVWAKLGLPVVIGRGTDVVFVLRVSKQPNARA